MTRKQFIGRSLLGFGSAFILPSMLQSCMKDHDLPNPVGGGNHPPLLTYTVDWNDDAKTMVASAIEMVPVAGDLLGGLVEILWPSTQEDVWGEIKSQVEALVNQQIAAAVYTQVSEDLQGLSNSLTIYQNELKEGTTGEILNQWMITKNLFVAALPHFQSQGNQVPLLPLFGQFVNLYLGILRDGVANGLSWGRTAADHQQDITDLKNAITTSVNYTTTTYNNGRSALLQKTKADSHHIEPFKTVNIYDRQMSQTVLVFMDMWPYFDVDKYPNGTKVVYSREIYSDPYGTADDSGPIVLPSAPTQSPSNITVWGWDRIDAVQVTYPAGGGPGGVTTTPRMGDQNGGSNQPPYGGSFNLSPQSIAAGRVTYGSIVNSMQFIYGDQTSTPMMGGNAGWGSNDTGWVGYSDTFLSSVHINGVSSYYGSADLVVFGFQYWTTPNSQLNAIQTMYVTSPKERSVTDFAKEFPNLSITDNLITDTLKKERSDYWAKLKARAEALK
ncbi:insecticidal delta-endotoxin Cry8Ea1 family protein [Spirosoma koreense]